MDFTPLFLLIVASNPCLVVVRASEVVNGSLDGRTDGEQTARSKSNKAVVGTAQWTDRVRLKYISPLSSLEKSPLLIHPLSP